MYIEISKLEQIPKETVKLEFDNNFNEPIDIQHLDKLTEIVFGDSFNEMIDNLPPNISKLKFGFAFNKEVNLLPNKLFQITFGASLMANR